jgi:hypothetical protein
MFQSKILTDSSLIIGTGNVLNFLGYKPDMKSFVALYLSTNEFVVFKISDMRFLLSFLLL